MQAIEYVPGCRQPLHGFYIKVHIFWELHKILRNLPLTFNWHYIGQSKGKILQKFLAFSEYTNFNILYSFRQEAPPVLKTSNGAIDCENQNLDCPLCASRQSGIIQDSCEGGLVSERILVRCFKTWLPKRLFINLAIWIFL